MAVTVTSVLGLLDALGQEEDGRLPLWLTVGRGKDQVFATAQPRRFRSFGSTRKDACRVVHVDTSGWSDLGDTEIAQATTKLALAISNQRHLHHLGLGIGLDNADWACAAACEGASRNAQLHNFALSVSTFQATWCKSVVAGAAKLFEFANFIEIHQFSFATQDEDIPTQDIPVEWIRSLKSNRHLQRLHFDPLWSVVNAEDVLAIVLSNSGLSDLQLPLLRFGPEAVATVEFIDTIVAHGGLQRLGRFRQYSDLDGESDFPMESEVLLSRLRELQALKCLHVGVASNERSAQGVSAVLSDWPTIEELSIDVDGTAPGALCLLHFAMASTTVHNLDMILPCGELHLSDPMFRSWHGALCAILKTNVVLRMLSVFVELLCSDDRSDEDRHGPEERMEEEFRMELDEALSKNKSLTCLRLDLAFEDSDDVLFSGDSEHHIIKRNRSWEFDRLALAATGTMRALDRVLFFRDRDMRKEIYGFLFPELPGRWPPANQSSFEARVSCHAGGPMEC